MDDTPQPRQITAKLIVGPMLIAAGVYGCWFLLFRSGLSWLDDLIITIVFLIIGFRWTWTGLTTFKRHKS